MRVRTRMMVSAGAAISVLLGLTVNPVQAGTVLFDNIGNSLSSAVSETPTTQNFTPTASGNVGIASFWAQCVGINCAPAGTISIQTVAGAVLGTGTFTFSDSSRLICAVIAARPAVVAGTSYRAVMTATGGSGVWLASNGARTLRVTDSSSCGPAFTSNPVPGVEIADMITRNGQTSFNTIVITNPGEANLNVTSASITGPNASAFSLRNGEPPLGTTLTFPQSVAVALGSPAPALFVYVVCTGSGADGLRSATLTLTTSDPLNVNPSWPLKCLVDSTPPTVQYNQTPDGSAGWFRTTPAVLSISGIDPESNNAVKNITCTLNAVPAVNAPAGATTLNVTSQGSNAVSCTATDVANNVSAATATTVKVDSVRPVLTRSVAPAANAGGWHRVLPTVTASCTDVAPGSGVAAGFVPDPILTADTAGTIVGCSDVAGNTAINPLTVKIDRTPPSFSAAGSPAANVSGWNNSSVLVTAQCDDTGAVQSGTLPIALTQTITAQGTTNVTFATCEDGAGNTTVSPTVVVRIDNVAPETTLSTGPTGFIPSSSASFTFSGSDANSGIAQLNCSLDGAAATLCTSPLNLTGLSEGSHSMVISATDVAGNTDASAARADWTIDLSAPHTLINSGPAAITSATTASIVFSGTDSGSGVASFECRLDAAAFTSCVSPFALTGLSDGAHSFAARTIDQVGNADASPAVHDWSIDRTGSNATILTGPPAVTNADSATFHFSATDVGGASVARIECALDAAPFTTCTSPLTLSGLTRTTHTFKVRAVDTVGNTGAFASYAWRVSQTPTAVNDPASTNEDVSVDINVVGNDIDPASAALSVSEFDAVSTAGGAVSLVGGSLRYVPLPNFNGIDTFTYVSNNGTVDVSNRATVTVTVAAVNDVPTFTAGGDVQVTDRVAPFTVGWASNISPGPADEALQAMVFDVQVISSSGVGGGSASLFAAGPTISPAGLLSFTPGTSPGGEALVEVRLVESLSTMATAAVRFRIVVVVSPTVVVTVPTAVPTTVSTTTPTPTTVTTTTAPTTVATTTTVPGGSTSTTTVVAVAGQSTAGASGPTTTIDTNTAPCTGLGRGGPLARTLSVGATKVGDKQIEVQSNNAFASGDLVEIGDGDGCEVKLVAALGSLVFDTPLRKAHPSGSAIVKRIAKVAGVSTDAPAAAEVDDLSYTGTNTLGWLGLLGCVSLSIGATVLRFSRRRSAS